MQHLMLPIKSSMYCVNIQPWHAIMTDGKKGVSLLISLVMKSELMYCWRMTGKIPTAVF